MSESFVSKHLMSMLFPHFEELFGYLCEKSFANSLTWIPSRKLGQISVEVPNITKEFGQQVIIPWLIQWSNKFRGDNIRVPYLRYNVKHSCATVVIPLVPKEHNFLKQDARYEAALKRWADESDEKRR